jgi:outer membrane protein assembly factor BamB
MSKRTAGLCLSFVLFSGAVLASTTRELHLAARSGDLAEVERLLEAGVPVNASDDWGTTALSLAANQGQVDVARYLLEKGADPSAKETFFGMSVLDVALWKGKPDYEIAKLLLAAGASDRATALAEGLKSGNVELARAAAKSGPVLESEARDLRARFGELEGELKEILAGVKAEPDPPPPTYTAKQLAGFAGRFEGRDGATATLEVTEGRLVLDHTGKKTTLAATAERVFRNTEDGVTVRYFGRAGTVEGLAVEIGGGEPLRMRLADSPMIAAADLPEISDEPVREATVNWPGFRGANRDGIGDGAEPPVEFDLESGKGVAWQADVPGLGNSSPVVWGDRVYVTTAVAEGGSTPLRTGLTGSGEEVEENVEHRWLLLAFDKKSGKQVWVTEVGRGIPLTKRHFKATQANSSPVTDGKHIVVVFPTAGLACVGADGKLHWKHGLGGLNAGGFNDPGLQWGFAASPILHDGKVILQVDIHEGAYLAAWSLKDGKPLWRTERPDVAPSWATPAIWPTPQGDQLVVNASIIRGYDPGNGKELWSLGPTSIQVVASPVVGKETLYVSSGYPPARPIYAVKPGIRGDHTIESDADAEGTLAWYQTRGGAYMPTPLLYRGLLYVVHHNARIVAHDSLSGSPVYKARFSAGGTCTASPVVANGKIYQGTEEGTLYVLAAGPEHRELAVHDFGEPLMATPAISEGLLLVRTPSKLIALKREDR